MPCERLTAPGIRAIVCTRRPTRRCRACGRPALLLCDHRGCKWALCAGCARSDGGRDLCPIHHAQPDLPLELSGVLR